jgi:hypothetical protein
VLPLASHPVLAAADVVAERDAFRLDFDPAGAPAAPCLLLEWTDQLSGIEVEFLAGRMRVSDRVVVLIAGEAGGTVSLPRRIGRARTAWLALSGEDIDADTALRWGLADAIE